MNDIVLYGHLTVDKVFGDEEYSTLGGIANVWQDLATNNQDLKIKLEPMFFGEAIIYVDKLNGKRYSKFCPNQMGRIARVEPSKLAHIAYLDKLKSSQLEEIRKSSRVVTADICSSDSFDINLLGYVDILFCSHSNFNEEFRKLAPQLVIHHSGGSEVHGNGGYKKFEVAKSKGLNVLGMGDKFAAKVISQLVKNISLENSVRFAHNALSHAIEKI